MFIQVGKKTRRIGSYTIPIKAYYYFCNSTILTSLMTSRSYVPVGTKDTSFKQASYISPFTNVISSAPQYVCRSLTILRPIFLHKFSLHFCVMRNRIMCTPHQIVCGNLIINHSKFHFELNGPFINYDPLGETQL